MGNSHSILLGQNVTPQRLTCSISTNIFTNLANFLGIIIQPPQKTLVVTVATLLQCALTVVQRTREEEWSNGEQDGLKQVYLSKIKLEIIYEKEQYI